MNRNSNHSQSVRTYHLTRHGNFMKFIVWIFAAFMPCFALGAAEAPLEVKVASIDAGKWVDPSDTSVPRIKALLGSVQSVYALPQTEIADIAAKTKGIANSKKLVVTISELLDFALIICETKCTKKQLVEYLSNYVVARSTTGQSHHQATHGLVILSNLEKRLSSNP